MGEPTICAIVTGLDNLPLLKETIPILRDDPLITRIVVVDNDSLDGTGAWLKEQPDVISITRPNDGAGPGRNTGLDLAGPHNYYLMLDMGIRPLRGATRYMLDYLERHPEVDVISPEIASCFTTDRDEAWRRMPGPIDESTCFPQRMLSSTAYCLCRQRAWDGIRFSEEGPYAEKAWGVDDNMMAFDWNYKGIVHHDFGGIKVYRRQSGSFARLYKETGIWPNQHGSGYEKRLVLLWQKYPEQWNKWNLYHTPVLDVSCVVVGWNEYPLFAEAIKVIHDDLRDIPHEVIFVDNASTDRTRWWLDTYALRQPHGDTTIDGETSQIIRRSEENEWLWTGDVIRIDNRENVGAGRAFNQGFDRARGKYIFYLAGDIIPTKGSVKAMYEWLEKTPDADYLCVNAWVSQSEVKQPEFNGFGSDRQGLGNYAYSYAMIRREIVDAGCRMGDTGPFAGPGCGFEEAEFANQMYQKGFKCWMFNYPTYYHHRRDFTRAGYPEDNPGRYLDERRRYLGARWPGTGFDIVHHHSQPPKRQVRRVAVVWQAVENQPGPGGHFLSALKGICEAEHFNPGQEVEGYDSYFYVDDGPSGYMEPRFHPAYFWAIDMVLPQQDWRQGVSTYAARARNFDKTYAAQPCAVEYLVSQGVDAEWLPLAANPEYHKPYPQVKEYDWVALWHNCGERIGYAEVALKRFPAGFVGWVDGPQYAQWLSKSKVGLNLSRSNELNMRVFEIAACGVPLVTDRARGLDQFFEECVHYFGYSDQDEMLRQIRLVLEYPVEAQEMALAARKLVLEKHTYYHRALQVFGK